MEDRNVLAADCIVICCCCECMILKIFILLLVKLPSKLLKSTKRYARKFRRRKKGTKIVQIIQLRQYNEDSLRHRGTSFRIEIEQLFSDEPHGCCMDEIETVLEEFSSKGEFAFGSFWGGEASSESFRSTLSDDCHEIDYDVVRYRLIELFGSDDFH